MRRGERGAHVDIGCRAAAGSRGCARRSPSGSIWTVQRVWLHLPPGAGALRARLYAAGVVREERSLEDGALELLVELPRRGSSTAGPRARACGARRRCDGIVRLLAQDGSRRLTRGLRA